MGAGRQGNRSASPPGRPPWELPVPETQSAALRGPWWAKLKVSPPCAGVCPLGLPASQGLRLVSCSPLPPGMFCALGAPPHGGFALFSKDILGWAEGREARSRCSSAPEVHSVPPARRGIPAHPIPSSGCPALAVPLGLSSVKIHRFLPIPGACTWAAVRPSSFVFPRSLRACLLLEPCCLRGGALGSCCPSLQLQLSYCSSRTGCQGRAVGALCLPVGQHSADFSWLALSTAQMMLFAGLWACLPFSGLKMPFWGEFLDQVVMAPKPLFPNCGIPHMWPPVSYCVTSQQLCTDTQLDQTVTLPRAQKPPIPFLTRPAEGR